MHIIFVIFIILFVYFVYKFSCVEGLNTFNGRMAIDDQYFYDKLFDNVDYYPNIYDKDYETGEEVGKLLKTGWEDCNEKCKGQCVEYGVHGVSYCFLPV